MHLDEYADSHHGELWMPEWRKRVARKRKIKFYTKVSQLPQIGEVGKKKMEEVALAFKFRANSYYLSLVNWEDENDPIKRIVLPDPAELEDEGPLDASLEASVTVAPGLEHKYERTAVLLVSNVCASLCRFCFRKRLFAPENKEVSPDLEPAFSYIREHPEIDNVLLTGGDSFMLTTERIAEILSRLREIPHIKSIRFGTKLLAFNPYRFIDDPELLKVLHEHSPPEARIYVVAHFNHPREISEASIEAINLLLASGVVILNQTPLMVGINDDAKVLAKLLSRLTEFGVAPYYVFQCRPTRGNAHFMLTLVKAYDIMEEARRQVSGIAKRARLVGSHATGKIEILGYDERFQYFSYHQAKDKREMGRFFKLPRRDDAKWWDDWMPEGCMFSLSECPYTRL